MPRLGVYVPDGLWDEARSVEPTLNPSQLVQAGLRRYIEGEKTSRRVLTPAAQAQIEEIRRRKAEQAEQRYAEGFEQGLTWAQELPWWAIDKLAGLDWDIFAWMKSIEEGDRYVTYADSGREFWIVLGISEPGVEDFYQFQAAYEHESVYRQGVQDALREVWNAVRQDQPVGVVNETGVSSF